MLAEQQAQIAEVASRIFGAPVKPQRVIGETLRRATEERSSDDRVYVAELARRVADPAVRPPGDYPAFLADPLSIWIESTFGLAREPGSGRLRRAVPISIAGPRGQPANCQD